MTRDLRHETKIDFRLGLATDKSEHEPVLTTKPPNPNLVPNSDSAPDPRAEAEIGSMIDLFQSTLKELHNEAPIELLHSLRESLEHIRKSNPNSAHTAKACLLGLASDKSTLLHVLTAAYLVNGGVMLKQQPSEAEETSALSDIEFKELEAELSKITADDAPGWQE